ncbi:3-hydroxyacyl-CoA dehydrogenase type-2-like [Euwallacea fornicatus]|uniref:3-hydroxyacyl-CoA dehydrogenase type-2-like n=1 Tax=Euwallacea fornicatus TaxID=995702 RepID=UPI00338E5EC6
MIQGSVFLITGGSSDLGRAIAEILVSKGACLTILDLQAQHHFLDHDYKDKILYLQVDITLGKDVLNALDACKRKFGRLNGVINCAGMSATAGICDLKTLEPHSLQLFTKILNVNLGGTFNVIRLAVPLIIENDQSSEGERGVIINASSNRGPPQMLAYSASRAAVAAMTLPLAKELTDFGIRILDVSPGFDKTSQKEPCVKREWQPEELAQIVVAILDNPLMLSGSPLSLKSPY